MKSKAHRQSWWQTINEIKSKIYVFSGRGEPMSQRRSHYLDGGIPPDPCADLLVEEGPNGAGVGPWVWQDKHRYLCEYLWATRGAWASQGWHHRVLIDPFCGPGRVRAKNEAFTRDGGVVAAWREMQACGVPFTHVFVGDKDQARVEACVARLHTLGAPVTGFVGEASSTVPSMAAQVPKRALALAYVDPYNLTYLSFDLFKALAGLRVDIAAHFSTMDAVRNVGMEFDPARDRFEAIAPGWRSDPAFKSISQANMHLQFLRYWQDLVKGLGYKSSHAMPPVHNDGGHAIYRLVFFARSDWPLRIWSEVAKGNPAQTELDF